MKKKIVLTVALCVMLGGVCTAEAAVKNAVTSGIATKLSGVTINQNFDGYYPEMDRRKEGNKGNLYNYRGVAENYKKNNSFSEANKNASEQMKKNKK